MRQGKARQGLEHLNPVELNVRVSTFHTRQTRLTSIVPVQVTGFSQMELNEIRPFFSLAFKRLLQTDPAEGERAENMQDEPDELVGDLEDSDNEMEEDDDGRIGAKKPRRREETYD